MLSRDGADLLAAIFVECFPNRCLTRFWSNTASKRCRLNPRNTFSRNADTFSCKAFYTNGRSPYASVNAIYLHSRIKAYTASVLFLRMEGEVFSHGSVISRNALPPKKVRCEFSFLFCSSDVLGGSANILGQWDSAASMRGRVNNFLKSFPGGWKVPSEDLFADDATESEVC